MPAHGEGYRVALGAIWFTLDVGCYITGVILLYTRRNYHPLKDMNPLLLGATLSHFAPSIFWVSGRELFGSEALGVTCGRLVWIYNLCLLIFAVPWIVFAYRLYLISDYERRKIAFAMTELHRAQTTTAATATALATAQTAVNGPAAGGGAGRGGGSGSRPPEMLHALVKRHTNGRMLALIVALICPVFIYVPLFLALDERTGNGSGAAAIGSSSGVVVSYDSYTGCAYYSRSGITFLLTLLCTAGPFLYVLYLMVKHKVNDGWHIRDHLAVAMTYCMIIFTAWFGVNIAWPTVNDTVFESAVIGHLVGWFTFVHMIVYPAAQTWTMKQTVAFVHRSHHSKSGGGGGGSGGRNNSSNNRSPKNATVPLIKPSNNTLHDPALLALTTPRASRTISIGDRTMAAAAAGGGGGQQPANRPLLRVLHDARGYDEFLAYVQSEFAAENVLFWSAVEEYRTDPSIDIAVRIYRTFVSDSGPLQVNISFSVYQSIHEQLRPFLVGSIAIPQHIVAAATTAASASGTIAIATTAVVDAPASPNRYRVQPTAPPSPAALPASSGVSGSRTSPAAAAAGGGNVGPSTAIGLPPSALATAAAKQMTPPLIGGTIGVTPSIFALSSGGALTRQPTLPVTTTAVPAESHLRIVTSNTLNNDELTNAAAAGAALTAATTAARAQLTTKTPKRSSLKVTVERTSIVTGAPPGSASPRGGSGMISATDKPGGSISPSVHVPLLFGDAGLSAATNSSANAGSSGGGSGVLSPVAAASAAGAHHHRSTTTAGSITTPSAVGLKHGFTLSASPSFLTVGGGGLSAAATASAAAASTSAVTARPGEVVERDYIGVFDAAQREIAGMIESDSFSRFLKTVKGKALSYLWADLPPTPGTKRAAAAAKVGTATGPTAAVASAHVEIRMQAFTFPAPAAATTASSAATSAGTTPSLAPASTDVKQ